MQCSHFDSFVCIICVSFVINNPHQVPFDTLFCVESILDNEVKQNAALEII